MSHTHMELRLRTAQRWMKWSCVLAAPFVMALATPTALAKDEPKDNGAEEETDLLGLAARMIHDGHYDRVLGALAEINLNDPRLDKKRYFTFRGIAHLDGRDFDAAAKDFGLAIDNGQTDPLIRLYLAQAHFGNKNYAATVQALKQAGNKVVQKESTALLMKAESHWHLGQKAPSGEHYTEALATLAAGARLFPQVADFDRLRIFYLIELGLYVEATAHSESYLARTEITEDDYVAVGEALRAAREYKKAQVLLEGARLRFPSSEKVALQLAHSYLDDERVLSGAMVLEDLVRLEPKYNVEAAELYKRGRKFYRALSLNARVADQRAKSKQRLSLLLDSERFSAVVAMVPQLSRLGVVSDDNVRYAVAYAYFKLGDFKRAEDYLALLTASDLYEASLQLRRAMDECKQAGWECTL